MASELVVSLVKFGLLALLWLFVLSAVRVVRADLYGTARAGRAPAPAAPAPPAGRPAGRRSSARQLVVTEGPLTGTALTLGDALITIGRADDSTLVVTDDYTSGRHARLVPGDGAWLLEDLGSTNGTFLGSRKVSAPVPVPIGQPIRIGRTVLELRR
ncbi:MAG: FHA domain-containing protein [Actinomycetota bacterium]|nr:FHA domain-containing protein [Actinomycetota bacterium]